MTRLLIPFLLLLTACGGEALPPLVATDVEVTKPVPGMRMSAGYLTLNNNTAEDIAISHVVSLDFATVEIHESSVEDGVARMRRVPELLVPARGSVTLRPGGKHLMLMRPVGDPNSVSLKFYSGDALILNVDAQLSSGRP
jgi:copper(I)-binding protein